MPTGAAAAPKPGIAARARSGRAVRLAALCAALEVLTFALRAALNGMLSEMDVRSVMPVWLAGFALAFSVVIAVISALIPAMNAMRISPLCAMRDE